MKDVKSAFKKAKILYNVRISFKYVEIKTMNDLLISSISSPFLILSSVSWYWGKPTDSSKTLRAQFNLPSWLMEFCKNHLWQIFGANGTKNTLANCGDAATNYLRLSLLME